MADNKYIRVFVTDARLSYPALDAPREDLNGEPRYQATFLLEPSNPCLAKIREAIRRPVGAHTVDGVKRRTRAGMGRCQGSFCSPRVASIISEETGVPLRDITKDGGNSYLLSGSLTSFLKGESGNE